MHLVAKLAWAHAVRYRARMLLTALAMVAAACVVIWVVAGYEALAAQFDEFADEYLGRYHAFVVPAQSRTPYLSPELIAELRGPQDCRGGSGRAEQREDRQDRGRRAWIRSAGPPARSSAA